MARRFSGGMSARRGLFGSAVRRSRCSSCRCCSKRSRARSARDLVQPAVYVTMGDSVREAFSRMHERRLEGLPVVDGEMRVVGYLDRLQLIRLWLRKRHREEGV